MKIEIRMDPEEIRLVQADLETISAMLNALRAPVTLGELERADG